MELLSIENKIIKVQGKQVILDSDVADLYGEPRPQNTLQ